MTELPGAGVPVSFPLTFGANLSFPATQFRPDWPLEAEVDCLRNKAQRRAVGKAAGIDVTVRLKLL